LVEIRIGQWNRAGGVQSGNLIRSQVPANGSQILAQLFFVAHTNDDSGNGRALQ
jgi:hypothetical protein